MADISYIRQVCLDLISKEKRKPVFEILDFYFSRARTIEEYDVLGELSLKAENRDLYLRCAENAYSMASTPYEIHVSRINLYKAYQILNQPEKSLFYIDINLKNNPDDFETLLQRAYALALMGNKKESEDLIIKLSTRPEVANNKEHQENIKFSLSGKLLREGHTAQGILNFINTFKPSNELFEKRLTMKKWEGIIQPGRTIYITGEGGIGDEIINIRFLKNLEELGMRPILYSAWNMYRPDIVDLFRRHGYEVISETYSINPDELWTYMMALPGYLNLKESDLWRGPYLTPLRNPKNLLTSKKFKIGIKCNGNPYFSQDQYRSIPIEEFAAALPTDNDNVEVYFFDKEKTHEKFINLKDRLDTWEDTLDYIDQMDIIVSSCTSLVHAAGAIGKRTIVMVPIAEYYTWTSTRTNNTTPWYGQNFTVLRQSKLRSWKEPLSEMRGLLDQIITDIK